MEDLIASGACTSRSKAQLYSHSVNLDRTLDPLACRLVARRFAPASNRRHQRREERRSCRVSSQLCQASAASSTCEMQCGFHQNFQRDSARKRVFTAVAVCTVCFFALGLPALAGEAVSRGFRPVDALKGLLSFVLHLDVHMGQIIAKHGKATYAILFGIVFCETGLVVTPFLPGDSLLFAAGAFAALGHLDVAALLATFITSAILGDAVNYQLGKIFGARAGGSRLVKKEYIEKTEAFYLKHGGKTVVLARFIPIVRTFAPFVAGVGTMPYGKFLAYNVGGAILWSVLFVGAGAFLGNLPAVKHNFSIVVFAIVGISLLPLLFEVAAARREDRLAKASIQGKAVGEGAAAAQEQSRTEGGLA